MTGVRTETVTADEADLRLDRWFKQHYPGLGHGALQRLLRTGQVRVDGKRAKGSTRLSPGARLRLPPGVGDDLARARRPVAPIDPGAERDLRGRVLYRDADLLAIHKPAGLAVQGGSGQVRHLDALLDALTFDAPERPRLVHRLDKATSGVLLLARTRRAARLLAAAFRGHGIEKVYWALVVGLPRPDRGRIDLGLAKRHGPRGDKVVADAAAGRRAITDFATVDHATNKVAWLALRPMTGRTHQLRAHCAALGTPIVGDGKYGGAEAQVLGTLVAKRLHLHARSIALPHPATGRPLEITAPLPPELIASWRGLGFEPSDYADPFPEAD